MKQYLDTSDKNRPKITTEGYDFLAKAVTDASGDVYAFTGENISSTTAAAAMARLSRSPHDMRVTILKEFAEQGKDEALLRRVITMFGDDSVQQLVGLHLTIENASNLLTKYVEWGRLAAYLEQSTRYIFYDEKNADGKYRFFTPTNLAGDLLSTYTTQMNRIFDAYSSVVRKLVEYITSNSDTPETERDGAWKAAVRAQACDAARPMLPVATQSTVGIFASSQAIENMIMRLRAHPNQEARDCGESILREVRKVVPAFFERADKPERGGGTSAYLSQTAEQTSKLVHELLPDATPKAQPAGVKLTSYYPKNDLDLAADIAYADTNLSLADIKKKLKALPDADKLALFDSYFGERLNRRHRPGRALENAGYTFDLVCDYGIFRDLQRHRIVSDLRWQKLTPQLGYDIPELITKAGLQAEFKQAFAKSADLYAELHNAFDDHGETAQYATLLGHNMRWRISFNAREAFHLLELRTAPQGHPGYRKLGKKMFDEIAKVHPNIARHMLFINKDEDPELTRLAAERATQRKLDTLDN